MITLARARRMALSLPETTEQAHHGMASFRVRGRIFATVPDVDHIRVMADERAILAAVSMAPDACAAFYWGRRLACVVVTLRTATADLVDELIVDAWLHKAPPNVAREFTVRT